MRDFMRRCADRSWCDIAVARKRCGSCAFDSLSRYCDVIYGSVCAEFLEIVKYTGNIYATTNNGAMVSLYVLNQPITTSIGSGFNTLDLFLKTVFHKPSYA